VEERILLVRLGALGDIVHLLPALDALRKARPEARITWVCEDRFAGLLRGHPQIDRLLEAPRREGSWTTFLKALRSEPYDVAVDLQGMLKGAWIVRASGARERLGYAPPLGKEMSHLLMTRTVAIPADAASEHHTQKAMILMGLDGAGAQARFPRSGASAREAERILGPEGSFPRVVLWPSSSPGTRYRRWDPLRYVAVARSLAAGGAEILVPEGRDDEGLSAGIVEALPDRARLLPFVPIPVLIELLARVDLVVGGDSGPVHMACSLGTPTVMIFGAKDPARYAPRGGLLAALYHPIGCNPCRNTWCEHVTCLDRIGSPEVLEAARNLLTRRPE
jgi:lipopolysaccharide heptosyltransferase I